ncbi:hypothetical protein K438DRAFT_1805044 [Mycena galopus ATCC 62051]|nr:hypothetical protein K438DRAFT_1805044 [Mycena galopus ATCC 62051]
MHRRAAPSLELAHQADSTETFGTNDEPSTPIRSRDKLVPARAGPAWSLLPTSGVLALVSLVLHSLLVVLHLVFLGIWAKGLENRVTFSLQNQKIVSFLITAISTSIGTVYSASLVFVTQTLSMRRSLQRDQPLTETHDNTAAWAGIGSAIGCLWSQKAVPASVIGVLSTFLYLANILVLHITIPALFSLETFSASHPLLVETAGLPSYNFTYEVEAIVDYLPSFLHQPLSILPTVFSGFIPTLGLHNGTMYEVLSSSEGVGTATLNGTGFNITCGYLPDIVLTPLENSTSWNVTGPAVGPGYVTIYPTQPGVIVPMNRTFFNTVLFYSTIPILDSSGNSGPTYSLMPPLYNVTTSIQVFGCSQTLVNQTVIVDSQTRTALNLEPEFEKTTSTWSVYTGPADGLFGNTQSPNLNTTGNMCIDLWAYWYKLIPPSQFPLAPDAGFAPDDGSPMLSSADLQLNQVLNLVSYTDRPANVTLHALENALSSIVASMFWTLGNIAPAEALLVLETDSEGHSIYTISYSPPPTPAGTDLSAFFQRPFLISGHANITTLSIETRLDVIAGLVISIVLLLLSLPSSLFRGRKSADLPIDGTGLLHAIWMFRNHHELETLLTQVAHPTHENLRSAGMVRTTLVGSRIRESFLMTRRGSNSAGSEG